MSDPLVIHTSCSRPENLPHLAQSFNVPSGLDVRWYISLDTRRVNVSEVEAGIEKLKQVLSGVDVVTIHEEREEIPCPWNLMRNRLLDRLEGSSFYFYMLDDDNILHPSFLMSVVPYLSKNTKGLIFSSIYDWEPHPYPWRTKYVIQLARPEFTRPTQIDTAQYIVHSDIIGSTRFIENDYCSDGIFIQTIFNSHPDSFVFLPQVLVYYNSLNPMKPWVPPLEIGF